MSRQPVNTSLRPIGLPRPVEVRVDADTLPVALHRTAPRGRRGDAIPIEQVEEVWRVAEAWWREAPQARTYYRDILAGGRALTLFHDDERGGWFEQPY